MKKVLFVATVDSHIELFHLPFLKMLQEKGYEVHVATETSKSIPYCDKKIQLPIKRSPFKIISNLRAVRKLKKILAKEKYEIIHCHTPVGGVVTRLAAKRTRKNGVRVIYTAHGFHFYKGAPIYYWLLFYPVEWYLAKFTDVLITINHEDYGRAQKRFNKRCRDIQYIPGVGVDARKFKNKLNDKEKLALRKSLGLDEADNILTCVGRLDRNKNQGALIREMKNLGERYHLLLVGPDENNGKYQKLAKKMGAQSRVHFLGFRKDISELLQISDTVVSASKREGLPVNLIEARMLGIPIKATDCRGNRDVKQGDISDFSLEKIKKRMKEIYQTVQSDSEIDFVVLWVDGNDPAWLKKKSKYNEASNKTDIPARYRDWETFRYWFRAVEKYAPWVHKIYLVTDNQKPEWLNEEHPKLKIIDHKEILEEKNRPCYNTSAIEINIHRIPDLSEHFVFFNDDVFLVNRVKPTDFFRNGLPVEIANINAGTGMEGDQQFAQMMFNDILLINRHFKKREVVRRNFFKWVNPKYGSFNIRTLSQMIYPYFTGYKAQHVSVPFLKSTFLKVWEKERKILEETSSHRFRDARDVNQYIFIQWQLCENNFVPRKKSKGASLRLSQSEGLKKVEKALKSKRKCFVCLNEATDEEIDEKTFLRLKNELLDIFKTKLPEKSSYEK